MSTHYGEKHAELLDQGINIASLFPSEYLAGLGSSYFGDGGGMLVLEQSPHLENPHAARMSILGAIAGRETYGDESRFSFALSNNVNLPSGTHVLLKERPTKPVDTIPHHWPDNALEVFGDVSSFVRAIAGNIWSADIYGVTTAHNGIEANVSGVFTSDEMQAAYLRSIAAGVVVDEHEEPVTAQSVRAIQHQVLTPTLGQLVTLHMSDHRPGSREAMLRLQA